MITYKNGLTMAKKTSRPLNPLLYFLFATDED